MRTLSGVFSSAQIALSRAVVFLADDGWMLRLDTLTSISQSTKYFSDLSII